MREREKRPEENLKIKVAKIFWRREEEKKVAESQECENFRFEL